MPASIAAITGSCMRCCASMPRAKWRWIRWPSSWASTAAYSPSVWALSSSPPLTPITPPGAAKALICASRMRMKASRWSQVAGFGQPVDAAFDEVLELRVGDRIDLVAQHAQPGAAQLELLLRRNDRGRCVAQGGQIVRHDRRSEHAGERQQGRAQYIHAGGSGWQRPYFSRWLSALPGICPRPEAVGLRAPFQLASGG